MTDKAIEALVDWRTSDGTVPSTRCRKCGRRTPMLVDGLGFDCCSLRARQGGVSS